MIIPLRTIVIHGRGNIGTVWVMLGMNEAVDTAGIVHLLNSSGDWVFVDDRTRRMMMSGGLGCISVGFRCREIDHGLMRSKKGMDSSVMCIAFLY